MRSGVDIRLKLIRLLQASRRRVFRNVGIAALAVVAGCGHLPMSSNDWNSRQGDDADAAIVDLRTVLRQFELDDSSGDPNRIIRWYAEDAVWQPVGAPAVIGRAAIRERYAAAFAADRITVRILEDAISIRGAMASVSGRTNVVVDPRNGNAKQNHADQFIMLWRMTAAGWRVTTLTWEPARPSNQ